MNRETAPASPAVGELATAVDEALELLRDFSRESEGLALKDQTPESLLDQCVSLCAQYRAAPKEPVRTIHHFACTGGTLISKCIAAMPNTQMLSEIDPLSTVLHEPGVPHFAPTDTIQLARQSTRGASPELVIEMFLGNLELIHADSARIGQRLVLRDHAHSHFCTGPQIPERPTLKSLVASRLPVLPVITVRDPIDSFLALQSNGWVHFAPQTFDEYCGRYLAFLRSHEDVPVVKYEDFIEAPQAVMKHVCSLLQLPFCEQFAELFSALRLTGDSGRKSELIEQRPRRSIEGAIVEQIASSSNHSVLRARLGYT